MERQINTEPDGWGLVNSEQELHVAFGLWAASGFSVFPSQETVANIDKSWYDDLMTLFILYKRREQESNSKK